jgi:hypothetical protein
MAKYKLAFVGFDSAKESARLQSPKTVAMAKCVILVKSKIHLSAEEVVCFRLSAAPPVHTNA